MAWTKTVSHVHTDYSDDGNASIESIIDSARVAGVGAVAITDHDTIDGARALAAIAPPGLQVIVGEEISTNQGHLIGLFLKRAGSPHARPPNRFATKADLSSRRIRSTACLAVACATR